MENSNSDTTFEINPLRLTAATLSAEMKVKHGMFLAQNMPTIKHLRAEFRLDEINGGPVRTWAVAAQALRALKDSVDEHMAAERDAA